MKMWEPTAFETEHLQRGNIAQLRRPVGLPKLSYPMYFHALQEWGDGLAAWFRNITIKEADVNNGGQLFVMPCPFGKVRQRFVGDGFDIVIKNIRVHQLLDMDGHDAWRCGFKSHHPTYGLYSYKVYWESENPDHPCGANPWQFIADVEPS